MRVKFLVQGTIRAFDGAFLDLTSTEQWGWSFLFKEPSEPLMVLYRHSLITYPTMPSLTLNTIVTIQPDLYSFIPLYIVFQQDVVIPGILSSMIVPLSAMDTSKPINPTFLAAVKEHLHLVRTCIFLYSRLNWCLVYTCSLITW